jgi:hypothetical protein
LKNTAVRANRRTAERPSKRVAFEEIFEILEADERRFRLVEHAEPDRIEERIYDKPSDQRQQRHDEQERQRGAGEGELAEPVTQARPLALAIQQGRGRVGDVLGHGQIPSW